MLPGWDLFDPVLPGMSTLNFNLSAKRITSQVIGGDYVGTDTVHLHYCAGYRAYVCLGACARVHLPPVRPGA
jgi:hypothetical protein